MLAIGWRVRALVRPATTARRWQESVVRTSWSVRWRGTEEQFQCREDAMDRWEQLDAWGIEAQLYERAGVSSRRLR